MKKAVSFLMAVVMVLSLCSCKLIPTPSSSVETVEEYEEFEYYEGKNKDKNKKIQANLKAVQIKKKPMKMLMRLAIQMIATKTQLNRAVRIIP